MATRTVKIKVVPDGFVLDFNEVLAARLGSIKAVLAERERELLDLKGPCSTGACRLHYAHSGPCDVRQAAEA